MDSFEKNATRDRSPLVLFKSIGGRFGALNIAIAALGVYWMVHGALLLFVGWKTNWARPEWKDGAVYICDGLFFLLLVGSLADWWKFDIAPNWPFSLDGYRTAITEFAKTHGPDDWYEQWLLERSLSIRSQYYARIRLFTGMLLLFVVSGGLDSLLQGRHPDRALAISQIVICGAVVLTSYSEMRQKLRKIDKEREVSAGVHESWGTRLRRGLWRACIIGCGLLGVGLMFFGLCSAVMSFVPTGPGKHDMSAGDYIGLGAFLLVSGGILVGSARFLYGRTGR